MLKVSRLGLFPWILAREKATRHHQPREPEPMVMDEPEGVREYDEAGELTQVPFHHFNALAMSRLLPEGGTVIDLGCGSGRLLARLARGRPDARIIGLDLSDPMLELGRELLARGGLGNRVELRKGDITSFDQDLPERVDLVSCNFALHQLPDEALVIRCLEAVARAREATCCAVYVFDLARLRNPKTWSDFLKIAELPGPAFRADAIASERAAFSIAELSSLLERAGLGDLEHLLAKPLGENQIHWAAPRTSARAPGRFQRVPIPSGAGLVTQFVLLSFPRRLTAQPR